MSASHPVSLEVGKRRTFAAALAWPGWVRSDRGEEEALEALVAAGPRYADAIGDAARDLDPPSDVSGLDVVERVDGDATTDFGAPSIPARGDDAPIEEAELERQLAILRAAWSAFDASAAAAANAVLRKGPRGGGRELDAIARHVLESDAGYLRSIAGSFRAEGDADVMDEMARLRDAIVETVRARARGEEPPPNPRRKAPPWPLRYLIRRSAWHALDHAWEIEDRAEPAPTV